MKTADKTLVKIPAEPIVMAKDQYKIDRFHSEANRLKIPLDRVINSYNQLGLGPVTIAEIQQMMNEGSSDSLVKNKVLAEQPEIPGGFKFSQAKLLELVDTPNTGTLNKALEDLKFWAIPIKKDSSGAITIQKFEIVDGESQLSQEAIKQNEDTYTTFAQTDAEKECYLVLMKIAEELRYLKEKHNFHALNKRGNLAPLYQTFHPDKGIVTYVDTALIKSYLNPVHY